LGLIRIVYFLYSVTKEASDVKKDAEEKTQAGNENEVKVSYCHSFDLVRRSTMLLDGLSSHLVLIMLCILGGFSC